MSESFTKTFTVFTATYNRANTLPRVWQSLRRQTFRDFEWLIVDDGSIDNTPDVVSHWLGQTDFSVRYLRQHHGHKKAAYNLAVRAARGSLLLPLDSDDECIPTALERLWWHWSQIPPELRQQFSAVTVLCAYPDGTVVGDRFPCIDWLDSDSIEVFHKWRVDGDKWGFQRTDVMRQFPFPDHIPGFVPEGIIWSRIARSYKTRYVNEILHVVHTSPDGLTRSRLDPADSAPGSAFWMASILRTEWPYFHYNRPWFLKCALNFTRFNLHAGSRGLKQLRSFAWFARFLILVAYPFGYLAYVMDRIRSRNR